MAAPGKASEKPLTASEMRATARRCLEVGEKERDETIRSVLHDEALRLAMAAEALDRSSTHKKPAA
jgi:hypothetical protein